MESKKCFQCNSELYSKVGGEPTKCQICGTLNERAVQHENGTVRKKTSNKHKSIDDLLIGGIIGSSLGD